jgi:hypothetical protein
VYAAEPRLEPVIGRPSSNAGALTGAWTAQCAQYAELIKGHLQLIQDRPDGQPIQIFQCIRCGSKRAGRPGWTTRCHVCHDKRTAAIWLERSEALYRDWLADLN